MKKNYNLLFVLAIPALFLFLTSEMMYPTGSPGGKTGSPGDNGANCTDCHAGSPINQEGWIFSPELMISGYSPGQVYNFFVWGFDENASKYGFEATAEDASGNKVGSFTAGVLGMTQTINNSKAITHTALGTTPLTDSAIWMFTWTAPPATVGPITFYAAVNAANGNGSNTGDQIYLTNMASSPATGIFDNKNHKDLVAYPNPSTGMVRIDATFDGQQRLEVMNMSGQLVFSQILADNETRIDLSHLDKGIYIARLGDRTQRLILR